MKLALVIITVEGSPTSMPYYDFTLFRQKHYTDCRQFFLLVLNHQEGAVESSTERLTIYRCGKNPFLLRKAIREIKQICESEQREIVFHIHEGKSVLFFNSVTFGQFHNQILYTVHNTFPGYVFHNKIFTFLASLQVNKIICVSNTAYKYFPSFLKSILKDRVNAIENGVNNERIDCVLRNYIISAKQQQKIEPCKNNTLTQLLYVARLVPVKHQEILLKALRDLPDCELFLAGTGKQEETFRNLSLDYGVEERVHFLGLIPREEVYLQMKEKDIYVSSSMLEGLPISVLEAMSCGMICAVSDIEQHREIQERCPSLITVKNTAEEWVKMIRRLQAMSPEQRKQIGAQNKNDVDRCFSLARMHRLYDRVYEEIAGEL